VIVTLMLRGYSRTRPVMKDAKHTGINTPRIPPDGCQVLTLPSYSVCAAGALTLWFIPEADE